ncbi:MAG: DUF58 domain-containing protein [Armatimonadota bacterium]
MTSMKSITVALFVMFSLAAAAILHFSAMFVMALALALIPFLSYIIGKMSVRDLLCIRELPEYAHEDNPIPVTVRIKGKANLLGTIEINDQLPQWLDRIDVTTSEGTEPKIGEVVVSYEACARKRGEYIIGPLELRLSDPLGFYQFGVLKQLTSRLVVLPQPLSIPGLKINPIGQTGEHQFEGTGAKGSGIDFHSVRDYHPGDELRRVHWPSTARHGKLNVMEFEHTKVEDTVIAIDLQQGSEKGSGRYTTLEYAIRIAADISNQAITLGSTVRLACAGIDDSSATPGKGAGHWYTILESLAKINANRMESLADIIAEQSESLSHNSLLICLGSSVSTSFPAYAEILTRKGTKILYILIETGTNDNKENELALSNLITAGVMAAVVECSNSEVKGTVTYEYPG